MNFHFSASIFARIVLAGASLNKLERNFRHSFTVSFCRGEVALGRSIRRIDLEA